MWFFILFPYCSQILSYFETVVKTAGTQDSVVGVVIGKELAYLAWLKWERMRDYQAHGRSCFLFLGLWAMRSQARNWICLSLSFVHCKEQREEWVSVCVRAHWGDTMRFQSEFVILARTTSYLALPSWCSGSRWLLVGYRKKWEMLTLFPCVLSDSEENWRTMRWILNRQQICPILCKRFLLSPADLPTACIYLRPRSSFPVFMLSHGHFPLWSSVTSSWAWELFVCNTQHEAGHTTPWWQLFAHPLLFPGGTQDPWDLSAVCSSRPLTHSCRCANLTNARRQKMGNELLK